MAVVEESITQPPIQEHLRTEIQTFVQEHRQTLRLVGTAAVVGVAGVAGGLLLAKSMIIGKGATAANLALAGKGATVTSGGTVPLSHLLMPDSGAVTTAIVNGSALADRATSLWQLLSSNILPLSIGAIGGGATGLGIRQSDILKLRHQLAEERDSAENLQFQIDELNKALTDENPHDAEIKEQLPLPTAEPMAAPTTEETTGENPAQEQPAKKQPANQQLSAIPSSERLERIHGIGRVFAQRLREAGIHTISDLAAQEPTTIETIIGQTRAGAMFEPQAWIAEAKSLMAPSDGDKALVENRISSAETVAIVLERLEAIAGLSPAVAARLNQAGIFTYGDLAAQQPEKIAAILGENENRSIEAITAWISTAQTLAATE